MNEYMNMKRYNLSLGQLIRIWDAVRWYSAGPYELITIIEEELPQDWQLSALRRYIISGG